MFYLHYKAVCFLGKVNLGVQNRCIMGEGGIEEREREKSRDEHEHISHPLKEDFHEGNVIHTCTDTTLYMLLCT